MIEIDCTAPEGNIFNILATCKNIYRQMGTPEKFEDLKKKVFANNYQTNLKIIEEEFTGIIKFVNK